MQAKERMIRKDERKRCEEALRHARVDIQSCITMIENQGNGDTCNDMRATLGMIDDILEQR